RQIQNFARTSLARLHVIKLRAALEKTMQLPAILFHARQAPNIRILVLLHPHDQCHTSRHTAPLRANTAPHATTCTRISALPPSQRTSNTYTPARGEGQRATSITPIVFRSASAAP